jgi:hypothetical protein
VSNYYAGEYKSAITRAKRVLVAAGFPWSKTTGRYSAFGSKQRTTAGVRVTRIGCSDTVALHVYDDHATYSDAARAKRRDLETRALATLRAGGLPFDDRGWLECGPRARAALAKVGPCAHLLVRADYPGIQCGKPVRYVDAKGRGWCAIHEPDAERKAVWDAIAKMEGGANG